MDPNTQVGAMISRQHMDSVLDYINKGGKQGAKRLCGGHKARVPGCEEGAFVQPTIFDECTDDMVICQDEIFRAGAILVIL